MSNIREEYKVQKSSIQESYERQLMLKLNKEYEDNANKAFVMIANYFKELYPDVTIELPKAREKSPKSLFGKIKNLQIERISKLFVVGEVKDSEKEELLNLLIERVYEHKELGQDVIEFIKQLIYSNVDEMNLDKFFDTVIETKLSRSTKTALLRILKHKVEESNLENKKQILKHLENEYGMTKAQKTGRIEDDLLRYETIDMLLKDDEKRENLYDEQDYLRAKDLRGMKIVISNIPKGFKTENAILNSLLQKRDNETNPERKKQYSNASLIELSREFVDKLSANQELLDKMNVEVIKDSRKHKNKTNGYIADHIKFQFKNNKTHCFELQVKSTYVEEIASGNGSASHAKRPGKERNLPVIGVGINFIKELQYMLPKYTILNKKEDGYVARKCSLLENTVMFFQNQLMPNTKEFEAVESIINEYEDNKQKLMV